MVEGKKIGVVGGGKMGGALIGGMISGGLFPAAALTVADTDESRLGELAGTYGVNVTTDNREAVRGAGIVILSVKPQNMAEVLSGLAGAAAPATLFISIAAGIATAFIEERLGKGVRVVRVMPNMPALIGEGAAALCRGAFATEADLGLARQIFDAVGITVEVEESLMDAVTGLSGSGPGYAFLIIEALADAGVRMGLDPDVGPEAFRPESPRGGEALPQGGETACGAPGDGDLPRGDDARRSQGPGGGEAPGGADRGRRGGDASLRGAGRPEVGRTPRSSLSRSGFRRPS